MDVTQLSAIVTLLIALSVASERLVAIVKGFIPWLNQENPDPVMEGRRKSILQAMAVLAGLVTSFLAYPLIPSSVPGLNTPFGVIALGLLASGGSGFWNSILEYVSAVKGIKKSDARVKKLEVAAAERAQPGR